MAGTPVLGTLFQVVPEKTPDCEAVPVEGVSSPGVSGPEHFWEIDMVSFVKNELYIGLITEN